MASVSSTIPALEIDVGDCPAGWSDVAGFDDAEIVVGSHGGFGASGHAEGLAAYFRDVNDRGGILGRQVRVESVDLAPGDAVQYLQGLVWALDQQPLAVSAVGGSAVSPEMAEQVDDACIPNLFWQAVQPVPDSASREWTVLGFESLDIEASIWMAWALERYGHEATIGVVAMDNGWGETIVGAIEAAAERQAPSAAIEVVWHDPAAATLAEPLTTAAAASPDVLIGATAGNPCLLLQLARAGVPTLTETPVMLPSVCSNVNAYLLPARDDAANTFFVDVIGTGDATTEFVDRSFWHGWVAGYMIGQAIEAADELPGGLSRTNLLRAAKSIQRDHPLVDGAVLGAGPARYGRVRQWSPRTEAWIDPVTRLFEVPAHDLTAPSRPACGWPARLSVTTFGWGMSGGQLAPDAMPRLVVDGLGLAIAPPEGVASGMVTVTSADGVEQFGRLFAVDQPCSDQLLLEPLPWFIEDIATRPGPYDIRVDIWLVSDHISASATLPTDGQDTMLELGSLLPPLD